MKKIITLAGLLLAFGASAQTVELVKDIYPGPEGSGIMQPVVYNGKLYFYADDGVHGGELWSTDGSTAGTQMVKDLNATGNSEITEITVVNGKMVFSAADANGYELWVSDGTATGTTMVLDINPGAANSVPTEFTVIGNQAFFSADNGTNGYELWVTDGTTAGTHLVKDINPTESSYPSQLTAFQGQMIFRAYTSETGDELWTSDGTEAGTVLLKDLYAAGDGYPRLFHEFNGLLYFRADDDHGDELWVTNGTPTGTYLLKDINPSPGDGSSINEFTEAGGQLFFRARTANEGFELWKTDGTPEGTVLVKDIWVGGDSFPGALTAYNGKVYFQATTGSFDNAELYVSDGTEAGTYLLKDIHPTSYSAPNQFIVFNGLLYFVASDGTNGSEFWVTDGTEFGTQKILADVPGISPMFYIPFYAIYNNNLYFKAEYGTTGAELHKFTPSNLATAQVSKQGFVVYPNPTQNTLHVQSATVAVAEVAVFSISGQQLLRAETPVVDVSGLSAGLYLVRIKGSDASESTVKFQKI